MRLIDFTALSASTGLAFTTAAPVATAAAGAVPASDRCGGTGDAAGTGSAPPPSPGTMTSVNWLAISVAPHEVFIPAIATPLPKIVVVCTPSTIVGVPLHLGQDTLCPM